MRKACAREGGQNNETLNRDHNRRGSIGGGLLAVGAGTSRFDSGLLQNYILDSHYTTVIRSLAIMDYINFINDWDPETMSLLDQHEFMRAAELVGINQVSLFKAQWDRRVTDYNNAVRAIRRLKVAYRLETTINT